MADVKLKNIELTQIGKDNIAFSKAHDRLVVLVRNFKKGQSTSLSKLSIYQHLKSKDHHQILPNLIGICEDKSYLICDGYVLDQKLSSGLLNLLFDNLLETICFLHSHGWYKVCFDFEKIIYDKEKRSILLSCFDDIEPISIISYRSTFEAIKNDFINLKNFIASNLSEESMLDSVKLKYLHDVCVSGSKGFFNRLGKLCRKSGFNLRKYFTRPWFYVYQNRNYTLSETLTIIEGSAGVGKTIFIKNISSPVLNEIPKFLVMGYDKRRSFDSLRDYIKILDDWFKCLLLREDLNHIFIKTVNHSCDLLCKVFPSLTMFESKKGSGDPVDVHRKYFNEITQTSMFNHQLLCLILDLLDEIDGELYLVFDDFQTINPTVANILLYFIEHCHSKRIRYIISYNKNDKSITPKSCDVLNHLRNSDCSRVEIEVLPFNSDEFINFLDIVAPKKIFKRSSALKALEPTLGDPLFLLFMMRNNHFFDHRSHNNFISFYCHVIDSLFGEEDEKCDVWNLLEVLSIAGKSINLNDLKILSGMSDLDYFDSLILTLIDSAVLCFNGGLVGFSHKRFADFVKIKMTIDARMKVNHQIALYLLNSNDRWSEDAELVFDIAWHFCQAKSMIKSVVEKRNFISACFAAAVKSNENGSKSDSLFFLENAVKFLNNSSKKSEFVDEDMKYVIYLEYCFVLKRNDLFERAYGEFKKLLTSVKSTIARLEIEFELIKLSSSHKIELEFFQTIALVFKRFGIQNISSSSLVDLESIHKDIELRVGTISPKDIKNLKPLMEIRENKFRDILFFLVQYYVYRDHRIASWIGMIILQRSLVIGHSKHTPLGFLIHAYYKISCHKDLGTMSAYENIIVSFQKHMAYSNRDKIDFIGSLLTYSCSANLSDYQAMVDWTSVEDRFLFENRAVAYLFSDFSILDYPLRLREKIRLVEKTFRNRYTENSSLVHLMKIMSNYTGFLLNKRRNYKNQKYKNNFVECIEGLLELKMNIFSDCRKSPGIPRRMDNDLCLISVELECECLLLSFFRSLKESLDKGFVNQAKKYYNSYLKINLQKNNLRSITILGMKALDKFLDSERSQESYNLLKTSIESISQSIDHMVVAYFCDILSNISLMYGLKIESDQFIDQAVKISRSHNLKIYEKSLLNRKTRLLQATHNFSQILEPLPKDASVEPLDHKVDEELKHKQDDLLLLRQKLLQHLFSADSKLDPYKDDPHLLLERFFEISKSYFRVSECRFWARHHGADLHNTINMYDFLTNLFYGYEKILFIDGICIKIETFFEETQASDLKVVLRLDHSETPPKRRGEVFEALSIFKSNFSNCCSSSTEGNLIVIEWQLFFGKNRVVS